MQLLLRTLERRRRGSRQRKGITPGSGLLGGAIGVAACSKTCAKNRHAQRLGAGALWEGRTTAWRTCASDAVEAKGGRRGDSASGGA